MTEEEAVNSMINNLLLLEQAHKMRLEASTDDDLVKEYIEIRIKSRVFIKEEQVAAYYAGHRTEFGGKDYLSVKMRSKNTFQSSKSISNSKSTCRT